MATVIKANNTGDLPTVVFNFEDMNRQAEGYLAQVRQAAAKIIADAQQQAAAVLARAQQDGRAAAMQAAEKLLDEKVGKLLESLIPALKSAAAQIVESREAWAAHWEHSAVHLAVAIAGKVIRREVNQDQGISVALIRESLEMASSSTRLRMALHPDDVATLGPHAERIASQLYAVAPLEVVGDECISLGSCRLDTQFGSIDQRFTAQLSRIEQELVQGNEQ